MSSEHQYLTHTMPCCTTCKVIQLKVIHWSLSSPWENDEELMSPNSAFHSHRKILSFPCRLHGPCLQTLKPISWWQSRWEGNYSGSFLARPRALLFPCTASVAAVSATNWRKGQARTPSFKGLIPSSRFLPICSSSSEKRQCYKQRLTLGTSNGLTHEVGPTFPGWHLSV